MFKKNYQNKITKFSETEIYLAFTFLPQRFFVSSLSSMQKYFRAKLYFFLMFAKKTKNSLWEQLHNL